MSHLEKESEMVIEAIIRVAGYDCCADVLEAIIRIAERNCRTDCDYPSDDEHA